jgi:hypothetical protein
MTPRSPKTILFCTYSHTLWGGIEHWLGGLSRYLAVSNKLDGMELGCRLPWLTYRLINSCKNVKTDTLEALALTGTTAITMGMAPTTAPPMRSAIGPPNRGEARRQRETGRQADREAARRAESHCVPVCKLVRAGCAACSVLGGRIQYRPTGPYKLEAPVSGLIQARSRSAGTG